jgi:hypothetical protein
MNTPMDTETLIGVVDEHEGQIALLGVLVRVLWDARTSRARSRLVAAFEREAQITRDVLINAAFFPAATLHSFDRNAEFYREWLSLPS